jgi:hypothetical protein
MAKLGNVEDLTKMRLKLDTYFFDDESIPPKSVKSENLRILFELPETTEA